ncbi:MAG: hypothetical protein KJ949_03580 [Nanoarchaeota archaeon]|nr:hypothetical protein [Nanoarchaeota archaeon]
MPKKEIKESEESELEEEIQEEQEFIDQNKFVEFMQNSGGSFSTSLEKVNSAQEVPINLEQDLMQSTSFEKKKSEEDPFSYSAKVNNSEDQPKYQSYEDEVFKPNTTDITSLGMNSFQRPEVGFTNSLKDFESSSQEMYVPAKNQDISSLGKENPLEKKEVKYKSSRG